MAMQARHANRLHIQPPQDPKTPDQKPNKGVTALQLALERIMHRDRDTKSRTCTKLPRKSSPLYVRVSLHHQTRNRLFQRACLPISCWSE
jgi:hypothetical protein